jgi:HK97 family phage major capsid protein
MKMNKKIGICAHGLIGAMLTRSVTAEQINANRGNGQLARLAEVRSVDAEARTVELAFSSETPVERWFGKEILDHQASSVRLGRLNDGGALLVNHDWDDQIGVVESASIDADLRGRAVVRFGRSARAEELFVDVQDGIRRHVSVGYMVHGVDVSERKGEPDQVRVVDWEPFEISIVAVPADTAVGVGRSQGKPPEDQAAGAGDTADQLGGEPADETHERSCDMKEKILRNAKGDLVRAKVDENGEIVETLEVIERAGEALQLAQRSATEAEQARTRSIMEMGETYGAEDVARDAVRDGLSVDDARQRVLDHLNGSRNNAPLGADADIGMSEREVGQYSFVRAIRALANPTSRAAREAAAFEFEASEAAAERSGKETEGLIIPPDVLVRAINTSTSGSSDGDTGGYSVATNLMSQSFIEMLRNRAVLLRLATPLGGLVGNVDIPAQESGASGYWVGEDDAAPEDGLELGQRAMSPKTVAAYSEITRKLLKQSSIDVEALVRRDLASALALTIDKAGFYGSGTGSEPLGIKNYSGINAVEFGTGPTSKPSFAEVIAMETAISSDNADVESMAYVMGSGMRGHMKSTEKFTGSSGAPIWEAGNSVNGYGTEVTNQVVAGDLFFGNFADLMVGMWGGLDITVDPYSESKRGRLRIVTMQDVDFVMRNEESFCYGAGKAA